MTCGSSSTTAQFGSATSGHPLASDRRRRLNSARVPSRDNAYTVSSRLMAIRADLLDGIHLALAADVVLALTAVVIISAGLNRLRSARMRPQPNP